MVGSSAVRLVLDAVRDVWLLLLLLAAEEARLLLLLEASLLAIGKHRLLLLGHDAVHRLLWDDRELGLLPAEARRRIGREASPSSLLRMRETRWLARGRVHGRLGGWYGLVGDGLLLACELVR